MERKSIVFTGKDQVEFVTEPVPSLHSGQILVESRKSLISTGTEGIVLSQLFEPGTHWAGWGVFPFHPGYANIGHVVEVGDAVTDYKPGDRVATRTGHAQYVVADANAALHVPDGVADEDAAWFALATIVQIGIRRAQHELGDAVVIIGAGALGQLATQYVHLSGAREIIVVDTAEKRLELAKAHGATVTLNMSVNDALDAVKEATGGRLADVVYDITGHAAVFSPALGLARRFGKLLLLGDTGKPSEQRLTIDVIMRGVQIIGAHDTHPLSESSDHLPWSRYEMGHLFFRYLERVQMRTGDLITHRYAPQDAAAAYDMLRTERAKAMGVIFDWSQLN